MYKNKKIVCVIPARLASFRYPEKMLKNLAGKPLLSWVLKAAQKTFLFDDIIFAVDDQRLVENIESFGGKTIMTAQSCQCGTDRLVELAVRGLLDADIVVNWQGDEPFIHEAMIVDLLQTIDDPGQDLWTLKTRIYNHEDLIARNLAKVVTAHDGRAIYFSRSLVPCVRDSKTLEEMMQVAAFYKHVGLYAFSINALKRIATMGHSSSEQLEKLEMLRWIDYGLPVFVHETASEVFGIDTPEDLAKAEDMVAKLGW
jgi:3-deoxy-manno-octulosonate cytidylyltransferase (CMP-KDO synthetase)